MAARTGASVGVAVTITILGAMSLAFFVTTMVFYGNAQSARVELETANEASEQFVSPREREHAAIRAVRDEAARERMTVVGYLAKNRTEMLEMLAGESSMTMAELREQVAMIEGAEGSSLFGLIENLNGEINTLNDQLAASETARQNAQTAARNEAERVAQIEKDFNASASNMQDDVRAYAEGNTQVFEGVAAIEARYGSTIEGLRKDLTENENRLLEANGVLVEENIALRDQIVRLQGEGGIASVEGLPEEALVDGVVNQFNAVGSEVMISIGREHKAVLGMTFAVYDDATDIRPIKEGENAGNYPAGKAIIEITRVEESFSRARVIESSQGNPIVRGDVIANAVYDPKKTYKFVVDGLFDTDGDGTASRFEREALEALIERWGGNLVTEVTGDVDFVVLGEKPILPPAPSRSAPVATIQEYVRLQQEIKRYDDLMFKAEATSIPLLNANRLQTLIGDFPR